ncbi:MAG: type II toxin-antitoxin system HicA family toxin [Cyanobacteria bacterium P01_G01_bin.54]
MTRIRQMRATQVERVLKRYGFELISQKGSHQKWRNQERKLQVTVPDHKGKTIPVGTLRNIMVSAGIPEMEWKAD